MKNFLNTVHMFWIMHFTLDQRVFENRVLPVHCYSLVMVSFLLKLYFFFLTSDVKSCQRMLFWWIGKQIKIDEMHCIINLFTPQLHRSKNKGNNHQL